MCSLHIHPPQNPGQCGTHIWFLAVLNQCCILVQRATEALVRHEQLGSLRQTQTAMSCSVPLFYYWHYSRLCSHWSAAHGKSSPSRHAEFRLYCAQTSHVRTLALLSMVGPITSSYPNEAAGPGFEHTSSVVPLKVFILLPWFSQAHCRDIYGRDLKLAALVDV